MKVLYTKLDGASNILQAQKQLLDSCKEELIMVAHRIDLAYFHLITSELKALATREATFKLLLSSTHLSSQAHAMRYLFDIFPQTECRIYECIHAKVLVADRKQISIGSANFTGDGIGIGSEWSIDSHSWDKPNFELGFYIDNELLARETVDIIMRHWSIAHPFKL